VAARSSAHASFGRAVRDLRAERGFSQEAFADACQIDRSYMGQIERGEANVGFAHLLRISRALGEPLGAVIRRYERLETRAR
jgi:transcriptional regulator with XRE-family HTH domain